MESNHRQNCRSGCKSPVSAALAPENYCVHHFIVDIEEVCSNMRREVSMERATVARRAEIDQYAKETASKLSAVAMGTRLSDDLKKRVLNTFLTLMNLQESVERSVVRFPQISPPQSSFPNTELAAMAQG
jgi:hypothetical protein